MSDSKPKNNSNPSKSHTLQMQYKTQDPQSIWTDGKGSESWSTGNTLLLPWGRIHSEADGYEDLSFFGTFGAGGNIDTQGKVGLRLSAKLDAGSVDIDCPLKVKLDYPTFTEVGQPVPVKTSFKLDQVATLRTTTPGASATLSFHAEGNFSAGASVKAFSEKLMDFKLNWPKDSKVDKDLFTVSTTHLGATYEYPNEEAPIFTAHLQVPDVSAVGKLSSDGKSVVGSGTDHLMALSLDVTNLLSYLLEDAGIEVPPFHMVMKYPGGTAPQGSEITKHGSSPCELELIYSLLDTWLEGKLGFKLDFRFTPRPRINLVARDCDGVTQPLYLDPECKNPVDPNTFVEVGTTLYYLMPASKMLHFVPNVDYSHEFSHTPNLHLTGSIKMDPFKLTVGGDVEDIPLPKFHWKPVHTLSQGISGDIALKEFHPTLKSFPSLLTGEAFSVVQQDIQLPGIASLGPARLMPYNQSAPNAPQGSTARVTLVSDSAPWSIEDGETKFYLSDSHGKRTPLRAFSQKDLSLVDVEIKPSLLVEGVYKIIAEVKPANLSKRESAADFEVPYWAPGVTALLLGSTLDRLTTLPAGSKQTTVIVEGTGFGAQSRVLLDGKQLPLTPGKPLSPSRIYVDVPAERLEVPGSFPLTVANPAPGGGTSAQFPLVVASRLPSLVKVTPSETLYVNGPAVVLSVEGSGLLPGAAVCVNGEVLETHMLSPTLLSAQVPAALLEARRFPASSPPELKVTVRNVEVSIEGKVLGGEGTKAQRLPVSLPPLYVSGFEPSAITRGATSTWVSFDGANFFGTPEVTISIPDEKISGVPATKSSTRALEFGIPLDLLRKPRMLEIRVRDSFGGGAGREFVSSLEVMKECFFGDNDGTIYEVTSAGDLIWHKDLGRDGTQQWAPGSGNVISRGGWDEFLQIIPGGDGILYAVTEDGDLLWYQDLARDGTEKWAPGSGNVIGRGGWTQFLSIISAGDGVLYPIQADGSLRWYKDLARNGTEKWAPGSSQVIRKGGFNDYTKVVSGGGGVLYAVTSQGNLLWFQDTACNGTSKWAPGSGQVVSNGWSRFSHVLSGGNAMLYAVTQSGDIHWFRDTVCNGTQKWAPGSGNLVGSGWLYQGAE